jgi:hypothetical protein
MPSRVDIEDIQGEGTLGQRNGLSVVGQLG